MNDIESFVDQTPDEEEDSEDVTRVVVCPPEASGERIDAWLARTWPDLSRARIQGLIGAQKVRVDGVIVPLASGKTKPGSVYDLREPPPSPAAPLPEALPLAVVFEDSHLIVIDKPAGMAVHPAPGSMTGTLVNAILAHCEGSLSGVGGVARPGIVHRIDKDTTGLIVVAKNDAAHVALARQFAKHTIERAYFAVTRGAPATRTGTISNRLARSQDDRRKFTVVRAQDSTLGKHAVTHFWTVETFGALEGASAGRPAAALLECRLETGRTHQIRAHLAHIGAPIIGDQIYGKFRGLKAAGSGGFHDAAEASARDFSRQALHAAVLGFVHPATGEALRFVSSLPQDMQHLLSALRGLG